VGGYNEPLYGAPSGAPGERLRMKKTSWIAVACAVVLLGCGSPGPSAPGRDYRQDMRNFVQALSSYARTAHPGFIVIPQDGPELASSDGEPDGPVAADYLAAVDGIGKEDVFYGYNNDNIASPPAETAYVVDFLDLFKSSGKAVLVTDYCWTQSKVDDSYAQSNSRGYVSFAASSRGLDVIPPYPAAPYNENTDVVSALSGARNFLYLIDPTTAYADKTAFVNALKATDYDLFVVDLFHGAASLDATDLAQIKTKPGGSSRLVICYMSIGEAEDYRWYWQPSWTFDPPPWLGRENPDWPGNYKVRYWDPEWQSIIFGSPDAYLDRILAAGFDGVYLDIINAFETYENR
jgi:cysteinyl-tRNA synthetase, unknown class